MKTLYFCMLIISLFLCYLSSSFAGELKVTKIAYNDNNKYDICFNNALCVKNIALKYKNDTKTVEFPVYAYKGKMYKQFSVLKRDYANYLASCISDNEMCAFDGDISFNINKFSKAKKDGNIKVFASVIFEDFLEVECRIMSGKNGLWVAWPANKRDSGWESDFVFIDKNFKKLVEGSLIQKYNDYQNGKK